MSDAAMYVLSHQCACNICIYRWKIHWCWRGMVVRLSRGYGFGTYCWKGVPMCLSTHSTPPTSPLRDSSSRGWRDTAPLRGLIGGTFLVHMAKAISLLPKAFSLPLLNQWKRSNLCHFFYLPYLRPYDFISQGGKKCFVKLLWKKKKVKRLKSWSIESEITEILSCILCKCVYVFLNGHLYMCSVQNVMLGLVAFLSVLLPVAIN